MAVIQQPQFETVLIDGGHRVDRLRVEGGWIYRDARIGAMVFVPDKPYSPVGTGPR